MSGKKTKTMRRVMKKAFLEEYLGIVNQYVKNICNEPFKVRLSYTWKILCKRNPHTGKKVK